MFGLKNGSTISKSQLAERLDVKTLKASRFIKDRNCIIVISDYTKNHHPDKWIGDTLHYTAGQRITGATNSKLADSRTNGLPIYLFQMLHPDVFTYCGRVRLAGDPYTEIQPNKDGEGQLVWVFPLKPDRLEQVIKPDGLVFADMNDYKSRGPQAYLDFLRRRANYIGYRIQHPEHGEGTVKDFYNGIITVRFDNKQTKTYNFDKSFRGGYLKFPA